ncbi:MAG: ATP-grasp domain-containing protein [Maricaulis sp.]|nr:ATP-grasp domain-containing protein [Maricaulis sp.]
MGLEVVVIDMHESPPAHIHADHFFQCNTSDISQAIDIARECKVDGVLSPATDIAVMTQAAIAEALNLVAPTAMAAAVLTDKSAFRRHCEEGQIPGVRWRSLSEGSKPDRLIDGRASIVKPNRASGGRGARKLNCKSDIHRIWPECARETNGHGALIEEWVEGQQLTIEGYLFDGRLIFDAFTERMPMDEPYVGTIAHDAPASTGVGVRDRVIELVERVYRTVGITSGPIDADIVVRPNNEPVILETSPRLGGNDLCQLIKAGWGVDIAQAAILHALGKAEDGARLLAGARQKGACCVRILHSKTDGILKYDEAGLDHLRAENWVSSLNVDYTPGSRVPAFQSGRDRIGSIVLADVSISAVMTRVQQAYDRLNFHIEENLSPV